MLPFALFLDSSVLIDGASIASLSRQVPQRLFGFTLGSGALASFALSFISHQIRHPPAPAGIIGHFLIPSPLLTVRRILSSGSLSFCEKWMCFFRFPTEPSVSNRFSASCRAHSRGSGSPTPGLLSFQRILMLSKPPCAHARTGLTSMERQRFKVGVGFSLTTPCSLSAATITFLAPD